MPRIPINEDENRMDQQEQNGPEGGGPDVQNEAPTVDVQRLQEERDSLFDRLARTTADFRNTQRRLEQEKEQAVQYANSSLIKSLLPVIDNFERALSVDPQKTDLQTVLKGMQIVHDQLIKVLEQQEVEQIAP